MHKERTGRKGKIFIFIAALFGALLLWMYAIGYDTEIDERVFSGIPVEIEGIGSNGYTVAEGESFSMNVDVVASGTRAVLNSLSAGDFKAIVDISTADKPGKQIFQITIVPPNGVTATIQGSPNATLYVDVFTSRNINVQITPKYSSVYEIGETMQSIRTVQVYGPESVIGTAEAFCEFELGNNLTEEVIHVSGEIRLRDSVTKKVISDMSGSYVTMDNNTVDVTFVFYGTKTVSVDLKLVGGVFDPKDVTTFVNETGVQLYGPISELAHVSSLSIRYDETQMIGNTFTNTITAEDLVEQCLPGSKLTALNKDAEITYSVSAPEYISKTLVIPPSRIKVENLPPSGFVQVNILDQLEITIFGPADAVRNYNASQITVQVNYLKRKQVANGQYSCTAEINTETSTVCVIGGPYTVLIEETLAEE